MIIEVPSKSIENLGELALRVVLKPHSIPIAGVWLGHARNSLTIWRRISYLRAIPVLLSECSILVQNQSGVESCWRLKSSSYKRIPIGSAVAIHSNGIAVCFDYQSPIVIKLPVVA